MPELVEYRWSPSPTLYRATRATLGPLLSAYFRISYTGSEYIPADGPVVLACNHLSNLDPILLAIACPRPINYLAKAELFRVLVLGRLIRRYGAIPLRRSASDPEAMRLAECVLEQNQVLALFPEGTRSRDGRLKPFRFGAARLAHKYHAALVPAAIVGTDRAMPAGSTFPRRATVRIAFGAPIRMELYNDQAYGSAPEAHIITETTTVLQASVAQLKQQIS